MDSRPSFLHRLYTFFFPHEHNEYRPHIFRVASVTALVLGVLVLEGGYLAETKFVFPHTDFLASVLPGALVALTNDDRAANAAPAVTEDAVLDQAATLAAQDMAIKGYFAHVSPDGKTPWDWLAQVGYQYSYAGENLAVNFTDSADVENAWMASPSHHANIVKTNYTKVGIGVANGQYQGKDATYVVQFFAAPAAVAGAVPAPAKSATTLEQTLPAAPAAAATTTPDTHVLGVQVVPAPPTFFARIAASPTHLIISVLSALAVVILILLGIAVVVEMRVQYLEIIGGGLLLLVVIIGVLLFNANSRTNLEIPPQSDSVTAAP